MASSKAAYHRDKHKAEANVHILADNWSKKMEKLQHASVLKKSESFWDSLKTVSGCKISGVIPFCSEDGQMLSNWMEEKSLAQTFQQFNTLSA